MLKIPIKRIPVTAEQSLKTLKDHGILINHYAEEYISHPCFSAAGPAEMTAVILSLEELGLKRGATLAELFRHIGGNTIQAMSRGHRFFPPPGMDRPAAESELHSYRNTQFTGSGRYCSLRNARKG